MNKLHLMEVLIHVSPAIFTAVHVHWFVYRWNYEYESGGGVILLNANLYLIKLVEVLS
jgi:hypothetical protein